jgi:hypothetical protein
VWVAKYADAVWLSGQAVMLCILQLGREGTMGLACLEQPSKITQCAASTGCDAEEAHWNNPAQLVLNCQQLSYISRWKHC